jgi:ATP-dependent Clp protease adapter protein ClpS
MEDIELELDDELHVKIVQYLGTDDPYTIQQWISEVLNTVFSEYLDKENADD